MRLEQIDTIFLFAFQEALSQHKRRGLQADIARAIGKSTSWVTDLAKGRRSCPEEAKRAIADYFNEGYEEFLNRGRRQHGLEEKAPGPIEKKEIIKNMLIMALDRLHIEDLKTAYRLILRFQESPEEASKLVSNRISFL